MMKTALTFLALALTGCATVETGDQDWYQEGATESERSAALAAAHVQARQAQVQPAEERDMVLRSMTAQGWRLVPKKSAPPLKSDASRKKSSPRPSGTAIP